MRCPLRPISYRKQVLHRDIHPSENWSNDCQAQKSSQFNKI